MSRVSEERAILQEFDDWLNDYADLVFQLSQEWLEQNDKIDTGHLLRTGNVERAPFEKTITYSAPYAEYVHNGRQPGTMPPPAALEKWVRRKAQVPEEEVKKVAFLIARAIKARGIQPAPFLTEAVKKANSIKKVRS